MTSKPSKPKIPYIPKSEPVVDPVRTVEVVKEEATDEQVRARKKIAMSRGRESTLIAGIQQALKQRLGQ